jgi:cysteinyl-tRNA synthetase
MSMKYLGEHFDIHGGGHDLIFPHHENEIAQSEAATGQPFANFWTENGLVNLSGEKMSKSTGRLFFIEDLVREVDPEVVRYYLLSTHYRSPIEFSQERLAEAGIAFQRLRAPLERTGAWQGADGAGPGGALGEALAEAERQFHDAMSDDFNSARAIGHLFDLSREVNRALDEGLDAEATAAAKGLLRLGMILGLFWKEPAGEEWSPEVLALVGQREEARKTREWAQADALRKRLAEHGVAIEDRPGGPKLRRLSSGGG